MPVLIGNKANRGSNVAETGPWPRIERIAEAGGGPVGLSLPLRVASFQHGAVPSSSFIVSTKSSLSAACSEAESTSEASPIVSVVVTSYALRRGVHGGGRERVSG